MFDLHHFIIYFKTSFESISKINGITIVVNTIQGIVKGSCKVNCSSMPIVCVLVTCYAESTTTLMSPLA